MRELEAQDFFLSGSSITLVAVACVLVSWIGNTDLRAAAGDAATNWHLAALRKLEAEIAKDLDELEAMV